MNVPNKQQKEVRLEQFLKNLSEDPSLSMSKKSETSVTLPELIRSSGELLANEPIDMARLVSLMLKKKGIEGSHEDIMEYVIGGGTVDDFMESRK